MNTELLQELLLIAIGSGIVMTALIQKIKEGFKIKSSFKINVVAIVVNLILGTSFALSFSNASMLDALWVGLFSYIGADIIYKAFEDKLFKSMKSKEPERKVRRIEYE